MKSTKLKTKTEKGITLIALIITIVVLMILAAVAINSITNEGILSQAGSAANKYNQAVKEEESYLQEYEDVLTALNGGYETYNVGDEVSITVGSETHNFYVIEDKTAQGKVVLLAKGNINISTLLQDGNVNPTVFSTEIYWPEEKGDIEETLPIPESHIAAKAAYDYGVKLGGKGRLMTLTEAEILKDSDFSTKLFETEFFFGTGYDDGSFGMVCRIASSGNNLFTSYPYTIPCGVRPVVEISKSKVTLVTE